VAAGIGAFLVFQPDASTSNGAVHGLARYVYRLGAPYAQAADVVQWALNVALFVPGAFAAALLWPRVRWWRWVLTGLAVSAAIEALQAAFLPARTPEARDLLANTLGAALGAGLSLALRRLWRRDP
jgi:glycopeptide antibiotics resistance protein